MNVRTHSHPPAPHRPRGDTHRDRTPPVDAVVVGGGPAGLSAALVLGRARQRVLVLDAGRPANANTPAVGGLLAQSRMAPFDLRRAGRDQLAGHPTVEVRDGEVLDVSADGGGFAVRTDGGAVRARALVLAHGLRYDPPSLPGIEPLWGRSVFHCPFCDGWEVRDLSIGVHGNGPEAARSALVVSGWSDDVVLLTDGSADVDFGEAEQLRRRGIVIRDDPVARLEGEDGRLARVVFADGSTDDRTGLFFMPRFTPSPLPAQLGCEVDESGAIVIDDDGRTSVAGVFAAGDATTGKKAVVLAAAAGSRAAYAINAGLASGLLPGAGRSVASA